MIRITATDLKSNLGKYLSLAGREDIHITKNGTDIAVLKAPQSKGNWVDELTGVISGADIDEKQIKAERLARKYERKVDYIITRNEEDFELSPIPAISPQKFLSQ